MQKPKFYRERAQVAKELAELFRDRQRSKCCKRPLNVGESLRGSLGHENEVERRAKPKSGDAPTRRRTFALRKQKDRLAAVSPKSDQVFDQAASCAFRFLRQPSRPNTPRPVAKSGKAVGSGVTTGGDGPWQGLTAALI